MRKETTPVWQEHLGLIAAVALGAFALGGFVVGAVWLWRASDQKRPTPNKQRQITSQLPAHRKGTTKTAHTPDAPRRTVGPVGQRPARLRPAALPPVRQPLKRTKAPARRPLRRHSQRSPGPRQPQRPGPRKGPQASSGDSGGGMWRAPGWIFNPAGGLIGKLRLLTLAEIKKVLGFPHLRGTILQGVPRSGVYDAVQFQPTKPLPKAPKARYGLGVQLWLHPQAAPIVQRWKRYQGGYPNARLLPKVQRVGLDSFVARRAPIHYLLFRTTRRHGLCILSCHEALCTRQALLTLAKRIDTRIQ